MIIWLAYRRSCQYGGALENETRNVEHLLDADSNPHALIQRVNDYCALPESIRMERGHQFVIEPFAMETAKHSSGGGGCFYDAKYVIVQAPTLEFLNCGPSWQRLRRRSLLWGADGGSLRENLGAGITPN